MVKLLKGIVRILSHNHNHYLEVSNGDQDARLCTRCTGLLIGFLISLPPILVFKTYQASGGPVIGVAVLLSAPDFLYWGLTRLEFLPDRNPIRVLTGILLGGGIALFGQANASWLLKIGLMIIPFLLIFFLHPRLGKNGFKFKT